jgi:hypothetical protein
MYMRQCRLRVMVANIGQRRARGGDCFERGQMSYRYLWVRRLTINSAQLHRRSRKPHGYARDDLGYYSGHALKAQVTDVQACNGVCPR